MGGLESRIGGRITLSSVKPLYTVIISNHAFKSF
jgi:hypothetical protein